MQRRKGASAERELFAILSENLDLTIERNLSQTRGGGADSLSIPGFSIEVKRQEVENLSAWWKQCLDQASDTEIPILFWRRSRKPWRAMVRLSDLAPDMFAGFDDGAVVSLHAACRFIREMK